MQIQRSTFPILIRRNYQKYVNKKQKQRRIVVLITFSSGVEWIPQRQPQINEYHTIERNLDQRPHIVNALPKQDEGF